MRQKSSWRFKPWARGRCLVQNKHPNRTIHHAHNRTREARELRLLNYNNAHYYVIAGYKRAQYVSVESVPSLFPVATPLSSPLSIQLLHSFHWQWFLVAGLLILTIVPSSNSLITPYPHHFTMTFVVRDPHFTMTFQDTEAPRLAAALLSWNITLC